MERAVEAPAQGAWKPVERRGGASLGKKPWGQGSALEIYKRELTLASSSLCVGSSE